MHSFTERRSQLGEELSYFLTTISGFGGVVSAALLLLHSDPKLKTIHNIYSSQDLSVFSSSVPGHCRKTTQQKVCPSTYFLTKFNTAGNQHHQAVLSFVYLHNCKIFSMCQLTGTQKGERMVLTLNCREASNFDNVQN